MRTMKAKHMAFNYANVVELVDTLALGASAPYGRGGSNPFIRT